MHVGRETVRLRLELTSPRRAADKLKFLAGSEAAMGAWIGDVPPESAAARCAKRSTRRRGHPMIAPADARSLFAALTGEEPVGVWSAPGRVNLIGEHTDYNDGFVLPFAIQQRTHAAVGMRTDSRIRVVSTVDDEPVEVELTALNRLFPAHRGDVPEWATYPLGVAWALLTASGAAPASVVGVDVAIASDVPIGAGLSSSAAIEGAVASALNDTWALGLDRVGLARVGRTAENEAVGAPTGIMDQIASMLGRPDAAIFLDCRSLEASVVDLGFADAGFSSS